MGKCIKSIKQSFLGKMLKYVYYWAVDIQLRKKDYIVSIKNSKFYLPYIKTDEIQKTIYQRKDYMEGYNLNNICKIWKSGAIEDKMKDSAVLDIGANIGNHTLYFLNECNANFVYCFEPADDTFQILKRNICINHLEERVCLMNVGVGSTSGEARIKSRREKDTGYTKLETSKGGGITIVAIDELQIKHKIGFVKIDVEGFELDVIKGMVNILKRDKPFIMIEVWDNNLNEISRILSKIGYKSDVLDRREMNTDYLFY